MIYVEVRDDIVVNRILFDNEMPNDWPDRERFHPNEDAQIGWSFDGETFSPPPAPEPPPAPVPTSISRRQLILALAAMDMITGEEALAAAKTGAVPAAVQATFDNLESGPKLAAEITWATMGIAERNHPLVAMLAAANDMDDAAVDDFFRLAADL